MDVPIHCPLRLSLLYSTQDSLSECYGMIRTIATRYPLTPLKKKKGTP